MRGVVLTAGLLLLTALAQSEWIEVRLGRIIERLLRRFTALDGRAYATLLEVRGDYSAPELAIDPTSWLADAAIEDLNLPDEGVVVLGIVRRDGSYVGSPRGRYTLRERDTVILYGPTDRLREIQRRLADEAGVAAHEQARIEHVERISLQDQRQPP